VTVQLRQLGTVLHGRYRLGGVLGKGGMAAVYLAEHTTLGGQVAIKEMVDQFIDPNDRAQAIAQFQSEARILYNLRHLNLPRVVEYFEEMGRHYLVMDYIDGETLQKLLNRTTGFLSEPHVVAWGSQICDVLTYLHQQTPSIIFRDLKPSNIMLDKSGTIKLIDFGIARFFNPTKNTDTLKMGTIGYAPPEQYGGKGQTTPRSDIYALGATMHQLLTRRDPSVQPFAFPPARSLNPTVSANTEAVLIKALEYDPAKRFQAATEMKAALLGSATATCPNCGQVNNVNEIYCQHCAQQLSSSRTCPYCNQSVPATTRYCPECGQKL
jgi:serine/threonine-protein kinase